MPAVGRVTERLVASPPVRTLMAEAKLHRALSGRIAPARAGFPISAWHLGDELELR